jgi:hypothetical protein
MLLLWARTGAELITVLGVPIVTVVKLFREAGGTDLEAEALIGHWAALRGTVEARIAELKAQVSAGG